MLIARQSQPDSSDGEMARFGFCAAPSLIFFGGGEGGDHLSKSLGASLCA